ncbi:MAG: c-type cytochrome [Rubrimonas sp.]|uniref:c-type cytochrome n=1 Tax=Rubrimonas sp. TaxID=2036015 RepID=UPI002FDCF43D
MKMRPIGAAMAVALCAGAGAAQEAADAAAAGRDLAERWCAACHAVADDQPVAADAARPFAAIAADPAATDAGLRAAMATPPHPAMTDPGLTEDAMRKIIVYIRSIGG